MNNQPISDKQVLKREAWTMYRLFVIAFNILMIPLAILYYTSPIMLIIQLTFSPIVLAFTILPMIDDEPYQ